MRKIVLLMHTSLDGFVAGPKGEMDWIRFDNDLWEYVGKTTEEADTAIYGRATFQMMESYWPTAAENPNATRHDIDHANWANKVLKIVFSKTMHSSLWKNTRFIQHNMKEEMESLKKQPGKNLLLIGSASIAHAFMEYGLIDEYWINVNPVLLGSGIPLFKGITGNVDLELVHAKTFDCGVTGLKYTVK